MRKSPVRFVVAALLVLGLSAWMPDRSRAETAVSPPSEFDWRAQGYVTTVKNQGGCGSCYAFPPVAAVESKLMIQQSDPGLQPDLSEQQIVSCMPGGGCDGANLVPVFEFIMTEGLVGESCFPYVASEVPCAPCTGDVRVHISGYDWVPADATAVKQAIVNDGPVAAVVEVDSGWNSYTDGVYTTPTATIIGLDSVTLVGYSDSGGYWIAKNSWGAAWGENGYIRLGYGVNDSTLLGLSGIYAVNDVIVGCRDLDGDGYGFPGDATCTAGAVPDCDDSNPDIFPGAPEICDGKDSDCDGVLPGAEVDADLDTFPFCAECDDADPDTYPNAPEINDGRDNQCPGDPGYGVVDEISGTTGFPAVGQPSLYSWPAQTGATVYQAARSTQPDFGGACVLTTTPALSWEDPAVPGPGDAYYYMVHPVENHEGSWGQDSTAAPRWPACSGTLEVFSFHDTAGDDIPDAALHGFFERIAMDSLVFLQFDIQEGGARNSWCSERADVYRDSYLSFAPSGGSILAGPWAKWYRNPQTGYAWVGPDWISCWNGFGILCAGRPFTWCSESGLGGLPSRVVDPAAVPFLCESYDLSAGGCGDGSWVLTIKVSSSRMDACGF